MRKIFFVLCISLILVSCSLLDVIDEKSIDLMPRETETPGWRIISQPVEYSGENLQIYTTDIEKRKQMSDYEITRISSAKYQNISYIKKEITIEIIKLNTQLNSFGILSAERPEVFNPMDICEDSYSTSLGFFFRKGEYYIKIQANNPDENILKELAIFSKVICNKLQNEMESLPDHIKLYSAANKRSDLIYSSAAYPLIPGVNKLFIRNIVIAEKNKKVFFAKRSSNYSTMGEFSNLLKLKEKPFVLSSAGDLQVAFNKIDENNFIFVCVYKEWIFGVIDAESMIDGKKIVNQLYKDLLNFLNNN